MCDVIFFHLYLKGVIVQYATYTSKTHKRHTHIQSKWNVSVQSNIPSAGFLCDFVIQTTSKTTLQLSLSDHSVRYTSECLCV